MLLTAFQRTNRFDENSNPGPSNESVGHSQTCNIHAPLPIEIVLPALISKSARNEMLATRLGLKMPVELLRLLMQQFWYCIIVILRHCRIVVLHYCTAL